MKYLSITTLLLAFGLNAATNDNYFSNDGSGPPETFIEKQEEESGSKKTKVIKTTTIEKQEAAPAARSETGVNGSSRLSTDELNTAPTPAPRSDEEVIEGTTLSTGTVKETGPFKTNGEFDSQKVEEIEAQEEGPRDYSATPEKPTSKRIKQEKKTKKIIEEEKIEK